MRPVVSQQSTTTVPGGGEAASPTLVSLSLSPNSASLVVGQSQTFNVTGTYSDHSIEPLAPSSVSWKSSQTSLAGITSQGIATGAAQGSTIITASLGGVTSNPATLSVSLAPVTLESLAITPSNSVVVAGSPQQLGVVGTYSDNSTQTITSGITWSSSSPSWVSVTASGVAVGATNTTGSAQTATITASVGSVSGSTNFTVPALISFALTPANPTLAKGSTLQFSAPNGIYSNSSAPQPIYGNVVWVSGSPSVATLSSTGVATGVSAGNAAIQATIGTLTESTLLTVSPVVLTGATIQISPAGITNLTVGSTQTFSATATGTYSDGSTKSITSGFVWSASNVGVATISNQGVASAIAAGSSFITASIGTFTSNQATLSVSAPPPTLLSQNISPTSGPIVGGNKVTLTGTGFQKNASVFFGSQSATVISLTSTQIVVVAPSEAAGLVNIVVTNPDSQSVKVTSAYRFIPPPVLDSLPVGQNSGPLAGGTVINLVGQNFLQGATVYFGTNQATVSNIISTGMTVTTPAGQVTGPVDVIVSNPDGQTSTQTVTFTYQPNPVTPLTITAISPNPASSDGGQLITVTGTGFVSGTVLKIGGNGVTLNSVSSTQITFYALPSSDYLPQDVLVTNPDSTTYLVRNGFSYVKSDFVVTGLTPNHGSIYGTTVTLTGTGFRGTMTATIGQQSVTFSANSYTSLTQASFVMPPTGSAGPVTITFKNADPSTFTLSNAFTYDHTPPTIDSLSSVTTAPISDAGGTRIAATGNGFSPQALVFVDGIRVACHFLTSTSFWFLTPAHAIGTAQITVGNPDGTISTAQPLNYQASSPSLVSGSGNYIYYGNSANHGIIYSQASKDLAPGFTLQVNSVAVPASDIRYVSPSLFYFRISGLPAGQANFTITNPDGKSVTGSLTSNGSPHPPDSTFGAISTPDGSSVSTVAAATDGSGDLFVAGNFGRLSLAEAANSVRLTQAGTANGSYFNPFAAALYPRVDGSNGFYAVDATGANVYQLSSDGQVNPNFSLSSPNFQVESNLIPLKNGGVAFLAYLTNTTPFHTVPSDGTYLDIVDGVGQSVAGFPAAMSPYPFSGTGSLAMDSNGNFYFGFFKSMGIYSASPAGKVSLLDANGFNNCHSGNLSVDGGNNLYAACGGLTRYLPTGVIDTSYAPTVQYRNGVPSFFNYFPLNDGSGEGYVVGGFDEVNNTTVHTMARLTNTGALDSSFASGAGFIVGPFQKALMVSSLVSIPNSGGDIAVGGNFSGYNGNGANGLARLHANGGFDPSLNSGTSFDGVVNQVLVDSQGRVYVANSSALVDSQGRVSVANGPAHYNGANIASLVRLTSTGALDSTFKAAVPSLSVLGFSFDGTKLYGLAGNTGWNGTLNRLNLDGSIDSSFTAPSTVVLSYAPADTGKIFAYISGTNNGWTLVRFLASGAVDPSFTAPAAFTNVGDPVILPLDDGSGRVLTYADSAAGSSFALLNTNGTVASDIGSSLGLTYVSSMIMAPDGSHKIVLIGGTPAETLLRLMPDGTFDTSFQTTQNNWDGQLMPLHDGSGSVIIAPFYGLLVKYLPNGTVDPHFPASNGYSSNYDNEGGPWAIDPTGTKLYGTGVASWDQVPAQSLFRVILSDN